MSRGDGESRSLSREAKMQNIGPKAHRKTRVTCVHMYVPEENVPARHDIGAYRKIIYIYIYI